MTDTDRDTQTQDAPDTLTGPDAERTDILDPVGDTALLEEISELDPQEGNEGAGAGPRGGRVKKIVAAVSVAGVLLGAGVAAWATADHNAWVGAVESYDQQVAEARQSQEESEAEVFAALDARTGELAALLTDAQALLDASKGQVADNGVRVALKDAISVAAALVEADPDVVAEPVVVEALERTSIFADGSRPERTFWVAAGTDPSVGDVDAAEGDLEQAIADVEEARVDWAQSQVAAAVAAGRKVLEDTKGEVADNKVRVRLKATLTAAEAAAADDGATVEELLEQRDAVKEATGKVRDAQEKWQAEQDRLAAEAAAAAAAAAEAAAQQGGSNGSGSSGSGGSSGGGSGSGSSGAGSSAGSGGGSSAGGSSGGGSGSGGSGGGSGSGGSSGGSSGGGSGSTPQPTAVNEWGGSVRYNSATCQLATTGWADSVPTARANAQAWSGAYSAWHLSGTSNSVTIHVYNCLAG